MRTKILGIALATMVLVGSAYANPVFTLGNHPQPQEQNILFHTDMMGMTVFGATNVSGTSVQFSSTTDVLIAKGGQSDIDSGAADGLINNITISVPGHTFLDLIVDPFKPKSNNDLTVTVVANDGTFNFGPYGKKNGDNFLTITTSVGEVIDSVTINATTGFEGFVDLTHPRLSGISGITFTPEPTSILLLGSGLFGIAGVIRRKLS